MKSDSFENFGRYKNKVNEKLNEFISNFEDSSERIKALIHYQSVINVSKEIIRFNNSEANNLKDILLDYFDIVKDISFSIDENNYSEFQKQKIESRKRYSKHILPVGRYLMTESEFKTKFPIGFYLFFGLLSDIIIYHNFSNEIAPLITIVFIGIGVLFRKNKKNENKLFAPFK